MMRRRSPGRVAVLLLGCAIAIGVSACTVQVVGIDPAATSTAHGGSAASASPAASAAPASSAGAGTALAVLATVRIKGRAPMTGYARVADFGTAWFDADRNGCDTRDDVLQRDLSAKVLSGRCKVLSGDLTDPYTKKVIQFVRGVKTSLAVQIDHMVPLGDAWQTGAQQLTQTQRVDLANDPINLLAVDGPTNESKGDGDAATWLPPNKSFRCTYVAHQVGVKAAYHLWMTQAEHDAIARILATCPTIVAPVSKLAPAAFAH
jgi:Protein of unknown function (DUF1524)